IPYAGNAVTSDIAYAFGTPPVDAEAIKVRYGCALGRLVSKEDTIEVPSVGGRPARSLQRQTLAEVIEPRYSELLGMVHDELQRVQNELRAQGVKHQLAAGVVLTGGAAQIEGIVECAEQIFQCQVRVGEPMNVRGLTDYVQAPAFSTAVGLLQHGKMHQGMGVRDASVKTSVGGLFKRLSTWLRGEF
ncbi:MAG: cell division protein FtsA, partial [Aeromonadaceae bacterium]|nr:cell division protein FtsA [Aeromonadaceae bacterium]